MHWQRRAGMAAAAALILTAALAPGVSAFGPERTYRVTIVNLTGGQPLTPPLLAIHRPSVDVFTVGRRASFGVKEIAENGNLAPLAAALAGTKGVEAVAMGSEPIVPAGSPGQLVHGFDPIAILTISAAAGIRRLSWVSMLICTNDGLTGVDSLRLPTQLGGTTARFTNGYDAGTERNTEAFRDIVPPCQPLVGPSGDPGTGSSNPGLVEGGVISHHPGITGGADLTLQAHAWQDPVALIVVRRVG